MTMDKSLRTRKGSSSVRGVLTRAERITKLKEQEALAGGPQPHRPAQGAGAKTRDEEKEGQGRPCRSGCQACQEVMAGRSGW